MSSEILALWKKQPGKYFVLATKSQTGTWKEHWFTPYEFQDIKDFVQDNDDKDIYFCPHGFNKKQRKKEYAVAPKLLWADLDEASPHGMKPKPTVAIESSPGRYVGLWVVDKPVTDDINRQLTYLLGADKGGWDYTQVLRFPGTRNYKYKSTPKVRVLWDDGPIHKLENIIKLLPEYEKSDEEEAAPMLKAQEVYEKYEKVIPRWARKELLSGRPVAGQRSEMLWKLEHALMDCGMTKDESFVLIKASPWNKFKGRREEDKQLKRELDKIVHEKLDAGIQKPHVGLNGHKASFLQKTLNDIEARDVDWIWYPYLARGEVTIIEGDPGVGKSWITQAISKAICDGDRLISIGPMRRVMGKVVYFDIENQAETVTKARMEDMGLKNQHNFYAEDTFFTIDDEDTLDDVYEALEEVKPTLIVFDTINTYIGGADVFRSNEVAQAMATFVDMARKFNCAVVVIRHLTKGGKEKSIYRGQGSMTFTGSARIVIGVGELENEEDPDDKGMRGIGVVKINIAKRPPVLSYRLKELPPTLKRRERTTVEWGEFQERRTVDDLFAGPEKKKDDGAPKIDVAKELIEQTLEDGPRAVKDLLKQAEKRGITERMLYRAADELKIIKRQTGFGKTRSATWEKPTGIDRGKGKRGHHSGDAA